MSEQISKLKLKGTVQGKILTVDENGLPVSSEKSVADVVTKDVTDSLDTRIANLEGSLDEAVVKLQDING